MIEQIAKLPRVSLGCCLPTPLMDAKRLSEVLGGPRIMIKRDDLTGLALGGNKCRRFEFVMGYAIQKGFDSFLLTGASNLSIQLAAAAAKLGVKYAQILLGDPTTAKEKQGNFLLHKILNSEDVRVREPLSPSETVDDWLAKIYAVLDREAQKLREEGYNPYVIRPNQPGPLAHVAWVDAADEIWQQLKAQNIEAQYLFSPTTVGGTPSSLAVGAKYLGAPFKTIGVRSLRKPPKKGEATREAIRMANETAEFLKLGISITPDELIMYDDYAGEGYGKTTKEDIAAIKLVAQTEGFFIDPYYVGKAMAGLIDLINKGRFTSKDTVVFIHTGGVPALFACYDEFTS